MSKQDVSIKEKNDVTEIEILPFNFIIRFDEDKVEISVKGNTQMKVDGDFHLGINGEFGIMTNKEPIHLDSIGSKLYLNSRKSKLLKNLPESKKYIEKMDEENKKHQFLIEEEHKYTIDRVDRLEKEMEELKLMTKEVTYARCC